MEFRYVYRRVEDAIGAPLNIKESHHSWITRQLRFAVRERRDIAHATEVTAICLSALSGNSGIDVSKTMDRLTVVLDKAVNQRMPYIKTEDKDEEEKKTDYSDAFAQLAKFTEELNTRNANPDDAK